MSQTSDKNIVTVINTFTVDPGNQQPLVDLLIRATDGLVSRASGFISSTLHRNVDGTKVAMYAQWRSVEDYQAMRQDPGPLPFLEEALTIAKFEPCIYESVRTFLPIGWRQRQLRQCASYTVRRNCRSRKPRHFSLLRI